MPAFPGSGSPVDPSAAYTVGDMVQDTLVHLDASSRGLFTVTDSAITETGTTLLLEQPYPTLEVGDYLSIDDELMWIRAFNEDTGVATVFRAMRGSTRTAHGAGTLTEINPRFPKYQVKEALRREIRSWPVELSNVVEVELTTAENTRGFDLGSDYPDFYQVLSASIGPSPWGEPGDRWYPLGFVVQRNVSDFASGVGIMFDRFFEDSRTISLQLATPYVTTVFEDATEVEGTIGISPEIWDIAPIGAAARLVGPREVGRTDTRGQGESRRAEEVPPMHMSQTADKLWRFRNTRISEERVRFRSKYPYRSS